MTTIPYEGRPAVLGNSMDITQFKEAQKKLEELQALESSVLAAIPHAVIGLENGHVFLPMTTWRRFSGGSPPRSSARPGRFFASIPIAAV